MNTEMKIGLILSLATAVLWALSTMCWASAGRRIGSFNVCLLRSVLASVVFLAALPIYLAYGPPAAFPPMREWVWLILSSASGMVLGDILFFEALVLMGARRTGLIALIAPVAAVLAGWLWLGEMLTPAALAGIAAVLISLAYVVQTERRTAGEASPEPGRICLRGVLLAAIGGCFVGLGSVLVARAFRDSCAGLKDPQLDMFVATVIRVGASAVLLALVGVFRGMPAVNFHFLQEASVRSRMVLGTVVGPVLGMLCYIAALKYTPAGLVSTLSSLSPLVLIFMAAVRYRARPRQSAVLGTLAAIAGVALIFWDKR